MELKQLKGTKDYLPKEQIIREKIKNTLIKWFKIYGFKPIETSILDFYDIAASKYGGGEEILKETFKLKDRGKRNLILRYELTFKLAKLIGLNPEIKLPFKRYEIGKVFRDGPVKAGRLREFTQCDVDIVGSDKIYSDAEILSLANDVFSDLKLKVKIKVNNRKFLFGLMKECKIKEEKFETTILSLDKLSKLGEKEVREELKQKGINDGSINKLFSLLEGKITFNDSLKRLLYFEKLIKDKEGREGIKELKELLKYSKLLNIYDIIEFDPTLARGLAYYTGNIWEIYLKDNKFKSAIAAGGRWDNMISNFLGKTNKKFPAVGIAFGLDSIYTTLFLEGISSFLKEKDKIPLILIIPVKKELINESLKILNELRKSKISSDISFKNLKKSLDFANKEEIPFVLIVGDKEIKSKKYKLKNMKTGKEKLVNIKQIISYLNSNYNNL